MKELLAACKKGVKPEMGRWGSLPLNGQVSCEGELTSATETTHARRERERERERERKREIQAERERERERERNTGRHTDR